VIIDRGKHELDTLEVWVEGSDSLFMPVETHHIEALEKKVETRLKEALIISCKVRLMKPRSIERSLGKAVRVVDKRQLND
jgi:phenylacetate-CoA ligase